MLLLALKRQDFQKIFVVEKPCLTLFGSGTGTGAKIGNLNLSKKGETGHEIYHYSFTTLLITPTDFTTYSYITGYRITLKIQSAGRNARKRTITVTSSF